MARPTPRLVDRLLIWLLAPVALERARFQGETLASKPALAAELLAAARRLVERFDTEFNPDFSAKS